MYREQQQHKKSKVSQTPKPNNFAKKAKLANAVCWIEVKTNFTTGHSASWAN